VAITFTDLAEAVIVMLLREGKARGDNVALADDSLHVSADVVSSGVQCLAVGLTGCRED
jgi:divalent metal cation (Fe/Co/Zn/Cd) transporter